MDVQVGKKWWRRGWETPRGAEERGLAFDVKHRAFAVNNETHVCTVFYISTKIISLWSDRNQIIASVWQIKMSRPELPRVISPSRASSLVTRL